MLEQLHVQIVHQVPFHQILEQLFVLHVRVERIVVVDKHLVQIVKLENIVDLKHQVVQVALQELIQVHLDLRVVLNV
jgi:hypothetical protein